MSYLGPLRLHFAGQFQADPSTVNNDVRHFDNASFQPQFQQVETAQSMNGWWNPDGSGAFRLVGCTVTSVSYKDGTRSRRDRVVGKAIADANVRVAGKIVDLDPQQQLVSELWGLMVRLTDGKRDFFGGPFTVVPMIDFWMTRSQAAGAAGDSGASTFYQSVIGPVTWGDVRGSLFLEQLRRAAPEGMLSIKFNLDGFNNDPASAAFSLGRIVGTIGPAAPDEPKHFVLGRQLLPQIGNRNPKGPMNYMQAVVDPATRRVIADFGNALPTTRPGGPLHECGALQIGYLDASDVFHPLGDVEYRQRGWYENTGGIQTFPLRRELTRAERKALRSCRVAVADNGHVIVQENIDGLYARADQFTFRLQPGQTANVQLWATQYGEPLPNATIIAFQDKSGLQPGSGASGRPPAFGVPETAIAFRKSLRTGRQGRATLTITAGNPRNPRGYIDGQVYGVRYLLARVARAVKKNPAFGLNHSDFVSLKVFDRYPVKRRPAWSELAPIFEQYGNLYPVMGTIVDMTSYESVAAHAHLLAFAFGLPPEDPNFMPVTRDLSPDKREAILRWLQYRPDGLPLRGKGKAIGFKRPSAYVPAHRTKHVAHGKRPADGAKTFAVATRGVMHFPGDE